MVAAKRQKFSGFLLNRHTKNDAFLLPNVFMLPKISALRNEINKILINLSGSDENFLGFHKRA